MIRLVVFLVVALLVSGLLAQIFERHRLRRRRRRESNVPAPKAAKRRPRKSPQPERRKKKVRTITIESLVLKPLSDVSQDAVIGQTASVPIVIAVETKRGRRVRGVPVRFEVSEGGGVLANRRRVAWVRTGRHGLAQMLWTMGPQVGPQRLQVSILNQPQQIEFVSFARPALPETLFTLEPTLL